MRVGDIQKTALLSLAMRADEASRPDPRFHDKKAQEILQVLGVDFEELAREVGINMEGYDPFLSHEALVARTIMFGQALHELVDQHPDAECDGVE